MIFGWIFRLAYYNIEKQISVEKNYLQNLNQNFDFWNFGKIQIWSPWMYKKKIAQNLSYAFQSKKCFKNVLLKNQSIASKPLWMFLLGRQISKI
jgi:hypothetical protein